MGQLRHIAMSVPDPWKAAEFYKEVFGLKIVGETDSSIAEGVFLTDGVINVALLKFKTEEAAQGKGKDFVGLHHIGFWVDDVEQAQKKVEAAGGQWLMGEAEVKGGSFFEVKFHDINNVIFDLTHNGWGGAQRRPGEPGNEVGPSRTLVSKFDDRRAKAADAMKDLADASSK